MKKLLFILIFGTAVLLSAKIYAEPTQVDSLYTELKKAETPQKKARLMMEISDYWSYRNFEKALQELENAKKYLGNDPLLNGLYDFYKAGIYFDKDIYKAQNLYKTADSHLQNLDTKEAYYYRAKTWHNFAVLEQMKGDKKSFLKITMEKCIPLSRKSGNTVLLGGYLCDVGMILQNLKEYKKAEDYYKMALNTLSTTTDNQENMAWTYLNLSGLYQETGRFAESAKAIQSAENQLKKNPDSQYNTLVFLHKAKYYNAVNDNALAMENIKKGTALAEEMHLDYDKLNFQHEKFKILKKQKKYDDAKQILTEMLSQKYLVGQKEDRLMLLRDLAQLEEQRNDYKGAFDAMTKFSSLKDTIQKENEKMQILNLESKYKNDEQQKSIAYLSTKNRQQKIIFFISALLLVGFIFFLAYIFYQRRARNRQDLINFQQEKELQISKALADGENAERERVAKELHDGLGGRITGIKIKLEQMARETDNENFPKIISQLDECLVELRATSQNIIPKTLYQYGIEEALKDFIQNVQHADLEISYYFNHLDSLKDTQKQVQIYRIIQEAVTNALKHANATKILIQYTIENKLLLLDIEDNGKGFDPLTVKKNLGLTNIEKRVEALNGILKIDSHPQTGTSINIECQI